MKDKGELKPVTDADLKRMKITDATMTHTTAADGAVCVAVGVSASGHLIYVLQDGTEITSTIRVTDYRPGDRFPIKPRRL